MSPIFDKPYTTRQSPTDGPPVVEYSKVNHVLQKCFTLSDNTGAIALIDSGGHPHICVASIIKKMDTIVRCVLMNSSNTEFSPVVASSKLINHYDSFKYCHAQFCTQGSFVDYGSTCGYRHN